MNRREKATKTRGLLGSCFTRVHDRRSIRWGTLVLAFFPFWTGGGGGRFDDFFLWGSTACHFIGQAQSTVAQRVQSVQAIETSDLWADFESGLPCTACGVYNCEILHGSHSMKYLYPLHSIDNACRMIEFPFTSLNCLSFSGYFTAVWTKRNKWMSQWINWMCGRITVN